MYERILGFFFVGITVLFVSFPVFAQSSSEARIANLERTVQQLQQRVNVLEEQIRKTSPGSSSFGKSDNSKDIQNWRQLQSGMSEQAVESLLGPPKKIIASEFSIQWHYNYPYTGRVEFDPKSRSVRSWSEP